MVHLGNPNNWMILVVLDSFVRSEARVRNDQYETPKCVGQLRSFRGFVKIVVCLFYQPEYARDLGLSENNS